MNSPAGSQLDPRSLVLTPLILGTFPFLNDSWWGILASGVGLTGYFIITSTSPRVLIRATRRVIWFLLAVGTINLLTTEGKVLFHIGEIYGTEEGLMRGIGLTAKLLLLSWCSLAIVLSVPSARIVEAFELWLRPVRDRVGLLLVLLTTTFNLVPLMVLAARQVSVAYRARGFDIDSGLTKKVHFLALSALPLFSASLRSARQLATAIEARGYDPSLKRSLFVDGKFSLPDWILLASAVSLCSFGVFLSR